MKKEKYITIGFVVIFIIGMFIFHNKLNSEVIVPNHTDKWSKAILVEQGDIEQKPAVLDFNNNAVVAYQSGNDLKIKVVDSSGKELKEKTIEQLNEIPREINLYKQDEKIYLHYSIYKDTDRFIKEIQIDENLNIIGENLKENIQEFVKLSDEAYAIFYDGYVEITDLKINKVAKVNIGKNIKSVAGNSFDGKYIITYLEDSLEFKYITVENGIPSDVKFAFGDAETSKIKIFDSRLVVEDNTGILVVKYSHEGEPSYETHSFEIDSTKSKEEQEIKQVFRGEFGIVVPPNTGILKNKQEEYLDSSDDFSTVPGESGELILSADVSNSKHRTQRQIVEVSMEYVEGQLEYMNKINPKLININTNTSRDSILPTRDGNYIAYVDCVKKGNARLELISTHEKFIEATKGYRDGDLKTCIYITIQNILTGAFYMIPMGASWILIIISIVSIISVIEFKLSDRVRKALFIICYMLMILLKTVLINGFFFITYKDMMPPYFTAKIGTIICLIMSIPLIIYGYRKYKFDLDYYVLAIAISPLICIDSMLTLMLYVPIIM
ncbi:hypothetical protein [Clostridium sp. ATCC 25772]|uniref:hypothetical protein n=1 Tax=Clostridium sp. ATCC 25772 TaxID=1676991 RepID=UPI000781FE9C|nr:hypothetical protein [Clostridium sp. ATCC 25772]